jgi:hypothetical protein
MKGIISWLTQEPDVKGRALRVGKASWLVVAGVSLVIAVASFPLIWGEATSLGSRVEYFGAEGHYRLTPPQLAALEDLGLTASWHGALVLSRQLVLYLGSLLVAWFVWRTQKGWAAVFVSTFLITGFLMTGVELDSALIDSVSWFVMFAGILSLAGLLFVLPDGRNIRVFGVAVLAWLAAFGVGVALAADDAFWTVGGMGVLVVLAMGLTVQIVQLIRTNDRTRRAVLGFTALFGLAFIPMLMFSDQLSGIAGFRAGGEFVRRLLVESVLSTMPLAFGIGLIYLMARGGLWDIDFAINRTVVYGILTTVLFAAYFALVALVQAVSSETFGIRDNTLALVLATAAGAALFLPLRAWLQRVVDRIFFRGRYDLEHAIAGFDERVRSRDRIDQTGGDLVAAAEEAFQPLTSELWIPLSTEGPA